MAEISRILRFDNILKNLDDPPKPVILRDDLPEDRWHGWKFIALGPDGKLYVPVGAPCNVCLKQDERYAAILRMEPDGSDLQVYARGVRNTVGFDWHPVTREFWFTDNGRDYMGDNMPPDELNHAPEAGLHFGFPYCHGSDIQDPDYKQFPCSKFRAPAKELGPHVAALGMRFYTGTMFPEEYQDQIFIPEHGSWNRSEKIGYRIMLVTLEEGRAEDYRVFAYGWLKDGVVWGRPVDLLILSDGSLLVSDDHGGAVYRIYYQKWLFELSSG